MPMHFINDLYSNILPPLLPLLIISLNLSHFEAGFIITTSNLLSAILNPLMGHLSEVRFERKWVMILGFLFLGISVSLISLAEEFWQLILIALLMSFGLSTYHPQALSALSEVYKTSKGKIFGFHGASGALGFSLAPLIIVPLHNLFGWRNTLIYAFIPSLIISLILWKFVPIKQEKTLEEVNMKFLKKSLIFLLISAFLTSFSFRGLMVFIPTYYVSLGESLLLANLFLFLSLIPNLIGSPIGGYLSDFLGRRFIIALSVLLQGIFMLIFSLFNNPFILFLIGLTNAFSFPVFLAYSTELSQLKSTTIGYMFGIIMGAASLSPAITGLIIDSFGFTFAFLFLSLLPFLSLIPLIKIQ